MTTDPIAAWRETQERVCTLVESLPEVDLEVPVPATPDWTARDLLAHMVGLGADTAAGNEPDDHNETWTQQQVDDRRDRTVAELVAEWRGLADELVAYMGEHGARPLGDAIIHEQDLRSALGVPGARDTEGFAAIRDRMAGRLESSLPQPSPVRLEGEAWSWGPEDAEVVVAASDFDLGRALMSRRTSEQLRSWVTRGDLSPYVEAFEVLGPLPDHPLPE